MSPYTVDDGPPDLTATHIWTPAHGGTAPPVINYQGGTDPPTLPWVRLTGITGWRALPESEDNREPRTFIGGELVYPSLVLGKTIVYELLIEANTLQTVQRTMTALQRGFGNMSDEGSMTVTPLAAWGGGAVWTYSARVISFDPGPAWDYSPFRFDQFTWEAALSLRMSDPHFYSGGTPYL